MWMTEDEEALLQCCSCKSLLRDPVLLRCLHNICSKCTEKERCVKGGSTFLVCPACNQDTDMGAEKENLFVAGQVSELEKVRNASRCNICAQAGMTNETADEWCSKCQMSMCGRCSSAHYQHNRDHWPRSLSEVGSISDLLETPAHKCRRHGKTFSLMCWTCEIPTCTSCAEECYQSKHEVEILYTQRSWDHSGKIKEKIQLIRKGLISKRNVLQHCKNAISELDAAQMNDIKELQANKRVAIDSLDRAYKAAEAALEEHYSRLREKALELKHSVELMEPRLCQASEYSRYLAASEDKIGLLHQESELLSGLQVLVKELDEIRSLQDTTRLVAIVGAMPENLDDHTSVWIGIPRLLTDDLCCSDEEIAKLEMDVKESLQLGDCSKSQHDENQSSDVAHELPDLGPASSAFQTPVQCFDVAVSSDGCRLLLAAWEHGLLECDMNGKELSRWRPAKTAEGQNEWVLAVEALEDGRVAVCLLYSECVVLLRRRRSWQKGAAWLEDKRVSGLQIEPRHLSVRGDLVAVAGRGAGDELMPGRTLLLLSLCCGRVLSRQKREYDIMGMAVTAQAALTVSVWVKLINRLNMRVERCVVDAYSHDGQLLWRQEWGEDSVCDMCAALCGRVVYMAVWGSERVTAMRAEDGSVTKDVLTKSSHGLKDPWRLSIGGRGQQTMTAVLDYDRHTLTVYRATGAQQQQQHVPQL